MRAIEFSRDSIQCAHTQRNGGDARASISCARVPQLKKFGANIISRFAHLKTSKRLTKYNYPLCLTVITLRLLRTVYTALYPCPASAGSLNVLGSPLALR